MLSSRKQSKDHSSVSVRQILKEIINENQVTSRPSSNQKENKCHLTLTQRISNHQVQTFRLNQAIQFLEKKIDRQNSEIKVISDQLSKEIQLKEELVTLLNDEKDKNNKLNVLLNNSNKSVVELRKKLTKYESKMSQQEQIKQQFEIKLNKYRQIVRKKDELLTKNQQKLEEFLKNQKNLLHIEHELKLVRQSFLKSKVKEESLETEIDHLKIKLGETKKKLHDSDEQLKFSNEKLRRLTIEFNELTSSYNFEQRQAKNIETEMKQILLLQNQQIKDLHEQKMMQQAERKAKLEKTPEIQINVYKNEIRRSLVNNLKNEHLKRKLEKQILDTVDQMQNSFNHILTQIFSNHPN